jgi:enediyne biosynthesis protein E4
MPIEAQVAPVYGILSEDIDEDGNLDVVMTGNDYGMEPYSGRHDAFNGLCLKGDGKGNFTPLTVQQSGFFVKGDAKALATIHAAGNKELLVATQNQDSLRVFTKPGVSKATKWITLQPGDMYAELVLKDNKKRRVEFYYGSTYLSQSSRKFKLNDTVQKITITNFKGVKRNIPK